MRLIGILSPDFLRFDDLKISKSLNRNLKNMKYDLIPILKK